MEMIAIIVKTTVEMKDCDNDVEDDALDILGKF